MNTNTSIEIRIPGVILDTVALCTMVLLAGCGGGDDDGGPTRTIPELSPGTADAEYSFSASATWEHDVLQVKAERELTLEVTDTQDDEITLLQSFINDGETQPRTYSGSSAELLRNFRPTPATLHLLQVLVADRELSPGNPWTAKSNATIGVTIFGTTETISYAVEGRMIEVTGTDSYAGIEYYTIEFTEVTADGELNREACVRPDGAFALYLTSMTPEGSVINEWKPANRSR